MVRFIISRNSAQRSQEIELDGEKCKQSLSKKDLKVDFEAEVVYDKEVVDGELPCTQSALAGIGRCGTDREKM